MGYVAVSEFSLKVKYKGKLWAIVSLFTFFKLKFLMRKVDFLLIPRELEVQKEHKTHLGSFVSGIS